ncbi:MAG TPA: hypothetical protein VN289_20525 [Paraburkholderia sp.]|nr:hypothetical protein [Paraburkholderia sp.]
MLDGAQAGQSWVDRVHDERIPLRAGRFDFDIEPHVHDALIEVLYDSCTWIPQAPHKGNVFADG